MALLRRTEDADDKAAIGPSADDQVSAALKHFAGLSVADRAAEVLAEVGPQIARAWDEIDWNSFSRKSMSMEGLLEPLVPQVRYKDLSAEHRMKLASLRISLAEAFQALVLSRMLICQDASGAINSATSYANSPDGLAALQRGDVAAVVARRLPD